LICENGSSLSFGEPRRGEHSLLHHFRCANGHEWQLEIDPAAGSNGIEVTCPHCLTSPAHANPLPPCDPADQPGERIPSPPDYEILGELGRGGMGVVYKARHLRLNRLVALKMILAGGHASGQELTRFQREAEAVARLQHPNIVQIYEDGEHQGLPFFAMEFVAGGSLDRRLQGRPIPPREAVRMVATLAAAVDHAHQKGVIHRDLKPANVLLGEGDAPKITDFGLAKYLDAVGGQTASGAVLGTPSYMAPEQAGGRDAAGGRPEIGRTADVYALGAILYELLTGRPPFLAETPLDTLLQVISQEPIPPRRLQPTIPGDLETVCLKCLEKDPPRRYPTALDLGQDLERWSRGEPISARPPAVAYVLGKFVRRHWLTTGLVATALLALLVGFATAFYYTDLARRNAEGALQRFQAEHAHHETALPSGQELYRRIVGATGWVVLKTKPGPVSGTCTLVDRPHRLVVTVHHVVAGAEAITIFFPSYRDGKLLTDREAYVRQPAEEARQGRVVASDPVRGLALVQLESLPAGVEALPWSDSEPRPGDTIHVVSNPGDGNLWSYAAGPVHQVYRKKWKALVEGQLAEMDARVVETLSLVGPGGSGAPLVNDAGGLVGIAVGGTATPFPRSMFVEAGEVSDFVTKYFQGQGEAWVPEKVSLPHKGK
jgi:tRNA A-37 threonylcarbamoyl transferase component Bud32